jgi:phosphoglycolate phosphatase
MSRIRGVIFDLGGTLVETQGALLAAMRETIAALGLPPPEEARLRANLGWSEPLLLRDLVPQELEAAATAELITRMRPALAQKTRPIAGAEAALTRLQVAGLRLALVSGFSRATLEAILTPLGWDSLFEAVVSGDDVARPRPAPDLLLAAAESLGLSPAACLAVGDSLYDLESAQGCGMPFAGVLSGAQAKELAERLEGRALASVAELPGSPLLKAGP